MGKGSYSSHGLRHTRSVSLRGGSSVIMSFLFSALPTAMLPGANEEAKGMRCIWVWLVWQATAVGFCAKCLYIDCSIWFSL